MEEQSGSNIPTFNISTPFVNSDGTYVQNNTRSHQHVSQEGNQFHQHQQPTEQSFNTIPQHQPLPQDSKIQNYESLFNPASYDTRGSEPSEELKRDPAIGAYPQFSFPEEYGGENIPFNQEVSFNMPGAFKSNNENMELDESPPFTIESDMFFDPVMEGLGTGFNGDINNNPDVVNGSNLTGSESQNFNTSSDHTNVNNLQTIPAFQQNSGFNDEGPNGVNYDNQFDANSIVPSQDGRLQHSGSMASMQNIDFTSGGNALKENLHLRNASIDSYQNSYVSLQTGATTGFEENSNVHYDFNSNPYNAHNSTHYNPGAQNNTNFGSMVSNGTTSNANLNNNNNYYGNDLSPLTTTTSLTPSVSSMHSTQPSFFSAHQYLPRNSLEQSQVQNIHRASFDAYSKKRQSMESQVSGRTQPQRNQRYANFTNSISNYIPFMSDKNQQRSGPPSPSSQAFPTNFMPLQSNQQSKHLIRSIFKGGNNNNNNNGSISNGSLSNQSEQQNGFSEQEHDGSEPAKANDDFMDGIISENQEFAMSPTKEEPDFESLEQVTPHKKAKRSKRSLFTRFKTPVKPEPVIEESNSKMDDYEIPNEVSESNNVLTGSSFVNDSDNSGGKVKAESYDNDTANHSLQASSISRTPSVPSSNIISNTRMLDQNMNDSLVNGQDPGSQPQDQQYLNQNIQGQNQEPDYAALFEKVGKRKNIVNPSTYIKSKPKVKSESETPNLAVNSNSNSNSTTERSSFLNLHTSHDGNNDHNSNLSVSSSNASSSLINNNINPNEEDQNLSVSTTPNTPNPNSNTTTTSSLANASMRILGSKLMSKKKNQQQQRKAQLQQKQSEEQNDDLGSHEDISNNQTRTSGEGSSIRSGDSARSMDLSTNVATIISKGVEVEVDLKSLDLPANTKIFPSSIINSKSRIRGRKENKEADMSDQSKIYLCNFCSRRFKRQEHLKRHFRSLHTFEKPYDCDICNKKFSRSDNLNQHLKIHKQEEEEAARALQNEGAEGAAEVAEA